MSEFTAGAIVLGLALANFVAFLVMRQAFVSLNKDLRVLLDRGAELRQRLDLLDEECASLRRLVEELQ